MVPGSTSSAGLDWGGLGLPRLARGWGECRAWGTFQPSAAPGAAGSSSRKVGNCTWQSSRAGMGQAPLGTKTTVLPWARAAASRDTKASRGHSSGHTMASTPSGSRSRSTGPFSPATCGDRQEVKGWAQEPRRLPLSSSPHLCFSVTTPAMIHQVIVQGRLEPDRWLCHSPAV